MHFFCISDPSLIAYALLLLLDCSLGGGETGDRNAER